LEDVDKNTFTYSSSQQKIILDAIKFLKPRASSTDTADATKNYTLLSLLYFISNDYVNAKKNSSVAIKLSRSLEIKRTLPAFIFATSSLYDKSFDFKGITNTYFKYSILAEPDNSFIPLMFSIYLSRVSLRINDDYLTETSLSRVFEIMQAPSLNDIKTSNYPILLSEYLSQLNMKHEQITSLTETTNKTIKNSKKTLARVTNLLSTYKALSSDANSVMKQFLALDLSDDEQAKTSEIRKELTKYAQDKVRLADLVDRLKKYQDHLAELARIESTKQSSATLVYKKADGTFILSILILVIASKWYVWLILIVIFIAFRSNNTTVRRKSSAS